MDKLSAQIKNDIDEFCVEHFRDKPRTHLGASEIGHDCERYLWYKFRWCFFEEFSARMHRLFERGHLEEMRLVKWLEGIGCRVETDDFSEKRLCVDIQTKEYSIQPKDRIAGNVSDVSRFKPHIYYAKFLGVQIPQFTISGCNGHFGGSMDGKVWLPKRYGIGGPVILEGKTSKTGSTFTNLSKKGVALEKEQHFAQQSAYGYKTGIKKAVYICANKNDDNLYLEVIDLDHNLGKQCELKAARIIGDKDTPPKISMSKTFYKCGYCPAKTICHDGGICEKNCRSCLHCNAVENKQWFCDKWNAIVPKENIIDGCGDWYPVTSQS